MSAITTLTFPFPPNAFAIPWATLGVPLLRDGLIAPNLLHGAGRTAALIVPWLLVLAATIAAAPRRNVVLALIGAALMLAAGMAIAPIVNTLTIRLQRGYIEEVYFEQAGAIRREIPEPAPLPPRLAARERDELTYPPDSWPF